MQDSNPEVMLVRTVMAQHHDTQRYVRSGDIVESCYRPLEVNLGFSFTGMHRRLVRKGLADIVQQLYSEKRFIPSDSDSPRIDGIPMYLTVRLSGKAGFFHIRWDKTTDEDWDNYLGILLDTKQKQDDALDRFQDIYDRVQPILEGARMEMGRVIKTYAYQDIA